MPIEISVTGVAKRAGLHRANQLGVKAGLSPGVAAKWWRGGEFERIDLGVLSKICEVCKCGVSDILIMRKNGKH